MGWLMMADDLLLKDSQVRALGSPLKRDQRAVFHWMKGKTPVVKGEDDWILHQDDLVPLATIDHLESSLSSSWLKVTLSLIPPHSSKQSRQTDNSNLSISSTLSHKAPKTQIRS
jgi:hypothetical protein